MGNWADACKISRGKLSIFHFPFFILFLILVGCNPVAKFSVVEAGAPVLDGLSALSGSVVVENDGRRTLTIENATVTVRYRDRELGRARLLMPIEMGPGVNEVSYRMALEGLSLTSMTTLATRMDAVTVDIEGWIRLGRRSKKIAMRGVEATRIMGIIF